MRGQRVAPFFSFALAAWIPYVLTWDPERGREVGGATRLELAVEDVDAEVDRLRGRGIEGGRKTRTRFGTDVFDVSDPDGHLVRVGPAWTLHAIEGAV